MPTSDLSDWMPIIQSRIETKLDAVLPPANVSPQRLHQAMRYSVLGGGKRIRPLLTFAAGELTEADPQRLEIVGVSIELIHAYSLIHDDLPCMDDDVLRRGKPTCHIQFDEATALLAGDSLQSLAFQLMTENHLADEPMKQLGMIKSLALATGSRGMAGGQAIDLDSLGKTLTLPELENMHIHKTGALIRNSITLGASCGKPLSDQQWDKLNHYAKCVGLAFQVVDDILDNESSTATLGKTAGKDAQNNKPTYVSLLGINGAKDCAKQLYEDAIASLKSFSNELRLKQLANFIILRKS